MFNQVQSVSSEFRGAGVRNKFHFDSLIFYFMVLGPRSPLRLITHHHLFASRFLFSCFTFNFPLFLLAAAANVNFNPQYLDSTVLELAER